MNIHLPNKYILKLHFYENIMSEDAHLQQIPSRATMFLNLIYLKMLSLSCVYFVNVVGIYSSGKSHVLRLGAAVGKKFQPLDDKVNSTIFFSMYLPSKKFKTIFS